MKKALLLGILFIIGCDENKVREEKKQRYNYMLSKTPSLQDCSVEVLGDITSIYVVRCPLSQVSVTYMNGKQSITTVAVEDPEITALKEKAEKLGFEVKKK